ncbi:hypothetical protein [Roseospira navarrensis]|uniref:Mu-like prophage FluMu protein gp28 n=1 Tax=Roseospira navarrensis TaxID=140058 RepID=A0A7X1ZF23_9PROT|nr:hypothetical protein [Roseospira navarrensis]MQX36829.1 hypothetical protein [Roseospira navarrensis]
MEWDSPRSAVDDGDVPGANGRDPLADGILMAHQRAWIADQADLKIAEKGRRTGLTYAEALDDVLVASAARSAGGDDVWYIGDTKDKGREFVQTCAGFAEMLGKTLQGTVEEFLFEDQQDDGTTKHITAWRITFASGFRIAALSGSPANIRGLQGIVVIDEAAFHRQVRAVLDAAVALLIWGGKIRVISTHNGKTNPFNDLIQEVRAGKRDASIHHVPFDVAVANGLYERVCLMRGWDCTVAGKHDWYGRIRRAYGSRQEAMREELDAVPREGDGTMLPLALIEVAMTPDYHVVRWSPPAADFVDWPERTRRDHVAQWYAAHVAPMVAALPADMVYAIGGDFAMRQDRSAYVVGFTARDLVRHMPLIVELAQCPYDQQKQVLLMLARDLMAERRRFGHCILDANGNGMVLAQEARQALGQERVTELIANDAWLRDHTPRFRAAFEDRTIRAPADRDHRDDLQQFRVTNGVGKIPRDVRTEGTDGGRRHADTAVAALNCYAALDVDVGGPLTAAEPVVPPSWDPHMDDDLDDLAGGRGIGRRARTGILA